MKGYDTEKAKAFMLENLDRKPFRKIEKSLAEMLGDFILYDLHFMRLTGVLDENGEQGANEYDEDEAFEYIYDAWLSDHPENEDEDMLVAELLGSYMELQYEYLSQNGLAEV